MEHYQHSELQQSQLGLGGQYEDSSNQSTPGPSNDRDGKWPPKRSAGSKKGTKRPRPTLSCTECVRRKSKCDRVIPCST